MLVVGYLHYWGRIQIYAFDNIKKKEGTQNSLQTLFRVDNLFENENKSVSDRCTVH